MMITPIKSIEEGLSKAFRSLGKNATIGIIPEGPLVIPVIQFDNAESWWVSMMQNVI